MSTADDQMERINSELPMKQDENSASKNSQSSVRGSNTRKKSKASGGSKKKEPQTAVKTLLWLLRKSIVPLIMVIMLLTGLYIGYVYVGKGSGEDVFQWSTWKHLYDLVFADS